MTPRSQLPSAARTSGPSRPCACTASGAERPRVRAERGHVHGDERAEHAEHGERGAPGHALAGVAGRRARKPRPSPSTSHVSGILEEAAVRRASARTAREHGSERDAERRVQPPHAGERRAAPASSSDVRARGRSRRARPRSSTASCARRTAPAGRRRREQLARARLRADPDPDERVVARTPSRVSSIRRERSLVTRCAEASSPGDRDAGAAGDDDHRPRRGGEHAAPAVAGRRRDETA